MRFTLHRFAIAILCLCAPLMSRAADELAVQVSGNGAAKGVVVILDSDTEKTINESGLVFFDLSAGAHSLQLQRDGNTVHGLRFDAAPGQLVDVNVDLSDPQNPRSAVERYFAVESAGDRAEGAKGVVSGRVRYQGEPVASAEVALLGAGVTATTDADGRYTLEAPRGVYQMAISFDAIGEKVFDDFRVISNVEKQSNFSLGETATQHAGIEEVKVVGSVNRSALNESERFSVNVVNTLGVEQLSRFGDSDIAAAVLRAPSITVQDNQFVFIRGLGGRYVSTTLNGATLPSTNPSKRTVPLDLFPSNLVEQLDIKKTFIPGMPGESTGGNLVINTRTFPAEREGKVSLSLGYVDGLTGDKVYTDPLDGDFDFIGWDDGARDNNDIPFAVSQALEYEQYLSEDGKTQLGRIGGLEIMDGFDPDREETTPDISLGVSYGDVGYLDSVNGELGVVVAGNYKNEWSQKDEGISRSYSSASGDRVDDDYSMEEAKNTIDVSGLIAIGFNIGDMTLESNTLVSRVTESRVRYRDGRDGDALAPAIDWTIQWEERQFLSQQFAGEHVLGENSDWIVDWQATASQASRYAPDRREVKLLLEGTDGVYNLEVPNLSRRFDDLTDENYDLSTDVEHQFFAGDIDSTVTFGAKLITRERDSDSETYGFNGGRELDDNAPNLRVSDVITPLTITGDPNTGFELNDKTLVSDSYEAEMDLNSIYATYDAMWRQTYQLVFGLRYEEIEQIIDTFSLQGEQSAVRTVLDEESLLPSLSINWFVTDDQQIRFAASQTTSRPDFKEMANATFFDDELDARVRGNPDLEVSDVLNYDLRWEKYWNDLEMVSVALFYKDMSDPIERVVQPASGTVANTRTFENAESADVWGIEVDSRKDFPLNSAFTETTFVAFNASLLDTEVSLDGGETRELQGAPDYTVNLILGYDDIANGHELTLLFNQSGESIFDVGVSGQADVIEEPRLSVDVNYKYELSDDITLKTKIKNLMDSEVEYTQGGNTYQSYKKGWEFSAGMDMRF